MKNLKTEIDKLFEIMEGSNKTTFRIGAIGIVAVGLVGLLFIINAPIYLMIIVAVGMVILQRRTSKKGQEKLKEITDKKVEPVIPKEVATSHMKIMKDSIDKEIDKNCQMQTDIIEIITDKKLTKKGIIKRLNKILKKQVVKFGEE